MNLDRRNPEEYHPIDILDELAAKMSRFPDICQKSLAPYVQQLRDYLAQDGCRKPEGKGERGEIHGLVSSCKDNMENKQVEALRKSEARLHALVSANTQVIYRMSPDWTEMRQLQGGNFLADTVEPDSNWMKVYIHPEDHAWVWEAIQKAIRSENYFELEHRVLRRWDDRLDSLSRRAGVERGRGYCRMV